MTPPTTTTALWPCLETCKRMKALGFPMTTHFVWRQTLDWEHPDLEELDEVPMTWEVTSYYVVRNLHNAENDQSPWYAAPLLAEILHALPKHIEAVGIDSSLFVVWDRGAIGYWFHDYDGSFEWSALLLEDECDVDMNLLTEAAAQLWLKLAEQGLLETAQVGNE